MVSELMKQLGEREPIPALVGANQTEYTHLSTMSSKPRDKADAELVSNNQQTPRHIDTRAEGMFCPGMEDKPSPLEARTAMLETEREAEVGKQPGLPHPSLSDLNRPRIAARTGAQQNQPKRAELRGAFSNVLTEVQLIPEMRTPLIEPGGTPASPLTLSNRKTARSIPATSRSVTLVAGAGFEPATFRL